MESKKQDKDKKPCDTKQKFKKVKEDELNKLKKEKIKNHINNGKDTFGV